MVFVVEQILNRPAADNSPHCGAGLTPLASYFYKWLHTHSPVSCTAPWSRLVWQKWILVGEACTDTRHTAELNLSPNSTEPESRECLQAQTQGSRSVLVNFILKERERSEVVEISSYTGYKRTKLCLLCGSCAVVLHVALSPHTSNRPVLQPPPVCVMVVMVVVVTPRPGCVSTGLTAAGTLSDLQLSSLPVVKPTSSRSNDSPSLKLHLSWIYVQTDAWQIHRGLSSLNLIPTSTAGLQWNGNVSD